MGVKVLLVEDDRALREALGDTLELGGYSYRVPCEPVAPGSQVPEQDMCIIESMPVKSLVTFPKSGFVQGFGKPLDVRGHLQPHGGSL